MANILKSFAIGPGVLKSAIETKEDIDFELLASFDQLDLLSEDIRA